MLFLLKRIKVDPPPKNLINFHFQSFQTIGIFGYRMVTRMLNPRGFIWGIAPPASHLEAAMVARACEDLEPLRVAIEKAREV